MLSHQKNYTTIGSLLVFHLCPLIDVNFSFKNTFIFDDSTSPYDSFSARKKVVEYFDSWDIFRSPGTQPSPGQEQSCCNCLALTNWK